jgi:hypothetical protein
MRKKIFFVFAICFLGLAVFNVKVQAQESVDRNEYGYIESSYSDYEENDTSKEDTNLKRNENFYAETDYGTPPTSCLSKIIYPKYTGSSYTMYWCEDSSLFCDLKTKTCLKPTSDQNKMEFCDGGAISYDTELKQEVCNVTKSPDDNGFLTEYPDGNKLKFADGNIGGIVSVIIQIVYWIAGLSMMAMIIIGGLQVMTSLGIPEKMKLGYGKMTGGVVGFLIIFSSYLIVKIVETIFGISILQ